MNSLFDLTGEVAVVLGATGALGGAMAHALSAANAKVAVVGRNADRGQALASELAGSRFFAADAANADDLQRLHLAVNEAFGAPTVLVNAVGGNDPKVTVTAERSLSKISADDWRASFDLNLLGGALLPCQEFGPAMCERGVGSIINIASVSAHLPLSRVIAYSSAKAAVLNLTQFLAREWAPKGVRVNSITPGFFPAEQNRRLLFQEDGTPTERARSILGHTPMARFGQAGELAGAIVFLASRHASSFVTGTDLRVDGGFLAQTI